MKIQIKIQAIVMRLPDNGDLVHYLLKEKAQENGFFGPGLWAEL